jgi:addiction module HigA family antidote
MYKAIHPGLIVKENLIDGTGLTVTQAALRLGVARMTLSRLLNGNSSISAEMAVRLSKFFGNSIEFWVNLQAQYDVWKIKKVSNKIHVDPLDQAA